MICFEVYRNGEKLCTAGLGEFGVMSAIINWVASEPAIRAKWKAQGKPDPMEIWLSVGGLHHPDGAHEYVDWFRGDLQIGDEIRVKIVECTQPDQAVARRRDAPDEILEQKKNYLLDMAKELGWQITTGTQPEVPG